MCNGGNDEFEQGQAAMRLFGRWPQADLLENEAISLGVSVLPQHEQRANILIWGGFGIAKSSQHQEAAWRFLRFYTGEEGAEVWQNWALPAVQSVANNAGVIEDPIEGVWLSQLKYTQPRGYTYSPYWDQTAEPALRRVLDQAIIDPDADIATLLKDAALEADTELSALLN